MKKRILSTMLTICMVLTLLPINALAEFGLVDGAIQGQVFGSASGEEGPVGETVNVAVYAQDNPDTALAACTTNTDGVFTLTKDGGFPAGNYTVVLTSNLYLTERREISIASGSSGYTFARIDLAVLGKVYGTVMDAATGATLSDVKVEAYRDSALIASTMTDASGAYSLEGERGSCQLVLTKDGYNSKTIDTKLSGPLSWELVDVQLTSTGSGTGGGGNQGGGSGDKAEIIASGTCGDTLTWTLDSNGILTISGVGDMSNYYPSPWYSYRNSIRSLIIENGITSIGDSAFRNCDSLTSIEIPAGVIYIGDFAFSECNNLIDVTISTGTTSIGNYAFSDCLNLASVSIPDTVAHLGSFAFHQCHSLASITIPSKVTCIEKETFSYCYSLSNITLPDSIMCIKDSAFYHCRSLSNITIPTGVTSIEDFTFFECASLTNITIPVGVSNIGNSSFRGCSNLSTIVVPDTLTNIGDYAFTGCMSLSDVYFGGNVEHWGSLVNFRGSELTGATIHYNSTGPEGGGENSDHFYETQNPVTNTKSLLNSYVNDWNADYTKYVEAVDKALQAFTSDSAPNRDEVIQSQKLAMMEADSRAGSRDSRYISGSVFPDDETKDAAYEALSTFLYDHIYSAIDLSDISAEDINGTKLVNTVLNGIRSDSETYQIGHVKVAITTSGFGSVSFGVLTCTSQRVAGLYTYGICSSTAKCEQAIRAYMRELVGLENSAIYQIYSAVCKDVLGQSLDKLTQNYLKAKLQPLLSKLPPKVGSLLTDLNSCYSYYQYVKKMMGWVGSADTPENILAAMQGIEFEDESIQDRSVKKAWKTLKKASSALNDAYMCYLSGTLDESKIATWWNSTVDWWSNKVTSLKAIFTCPVNVSVYDSSGQEIGYVGDDDIWYTDDLIYIEERGDAKIVYSFTDDLISFQVSATDYGTLGCCIEQYDRSGRPTGRINYYDIELYPNKKLSVWGNRDEENVSYKITADNNVIDADEYIPSNQNAAISVHCSCTPGGTVSGAGTYVRGDAVVLTASPETGYHFAGWYQGEALVSTSKVYEFSARESLDLTASFGLDLTGNATEGINASISSADLCLVQLDDPGSLLGGDTKIFAVQYENGRILEVLPGELHLDDVSCSVEFSHELDGNWTLLFLDPASLTPLCKSIVL